jgi:hypothetical protein
MSQKKPTLGRGLADLLGHTLRPLQPVSVAVPVSGGSAANGTAPPAPGARAASESGTALGSPPDSPSGTTSATDSTPIAGAPYAPHGPVPGAGAHAADSAADAAANANSLAPGEELARLPIDLLQKGKYQPRIDMRQETLQELADSIKAQGVIQPIVVRPVGVPGIGESQRYEIIAGERRWRAAHMAGLT